MSNVLTVSFKSGSRIFLSFMIFVFFINASLLAEGVQPTGTGTSGDPYQVADLDNLRWVSTNSTSWSSHFIQTADIDATSTSTWNSGAGFEPIGLSSSNYFSGNYNGQGFEIDGLFINRHLYEDQGLFGYADGATISNIAVTNVNILGQDSTGGLGGYIRSSSINNCYSTGSVHGRNETGGLVGYNAYGSINNCYSTGSVEGSTPNGHGDQVGGLVGYNVYCSIDNCYSTAAVSEGIIIGGLVGVNTYGSTISNCYSTGVVSGQYTCGGLVGANYYYVNNSFWNTQTSGQSSSSGGYGRTTAQMQSMSTFINAGWDFIGEDINGANDYWGINGSDNGLYPFLSWQGFNHNVYPPGGSGTEIDPYIIEHIAHLGWVSQHSTYWDKYFIQTADIDASLTQTWNNGEGFSPIGIDETNYFSGNYDGQGYEIDGLFINRPDSNQQSFIGYTDSATVSNLGVINTDITGNSRSAGLVGFNTNSTITNCYSTGIITGNWTTAGLVGRNDTGNISNCYSAANITATGNHNGGLVGANDFSSIISNCYSTGNVIGFDENFGGLVGTNANTSEINNCYSTGNVSGGTGNVGGLVGRTLNGAVTTDSFWDLDTSGQTISAGGTGKTTVEMQTQSTFTDAGWDFAYETTNGTNDNWDITQVNNNGYAFLNWQKYLPTVITTTATSISMDSAVSGGEVVGGANITARGVCWNTAVNPTIANANTYNGTGMGSFISNLNGLNISTTYYYRAYATNSVGTSYGEEYSFITTPEGSGASGDPYQISTLAELRWISENSSSWSSYFIQVADIDATPTSTWNGGEGFSPIGIDETNYFSGNYDGQGYEIDGLFINRIVSDQSLFGYSNGAEFSNIIMLNVSVTGSVRSAGLVGYNTNSTINNCYSTGTVNGYWDSGGLVGRNTNSSISNCYSTVDVYGTGTHLGGFAGASDTNSNITNCYSTGSVHAEGDYAGGFVGDNISGSSINFCYSVGSVTGVGTVGGFAGNNEAMVTNSFWDTETSGQATSAGGTAKTTLEMQTQSTFTDAGWDFAYETINGTDDYWDITQVDNNGYPFFCWQYYLSTVTTTAATSITSSSASSGGEITDDGGAAVTAKGVCWSTTINPTIADSYTNDGTGTGSFTSNLTGLSISTTYYYRAYATNCVGTSYGEEYSFITTPVGSGTSGDPYQISNLGCLRWLSESPSSWSSYFIQTADIDASDTQNWNNGAGFSPIGMQSYYFLGNYGGQGFTIDGLFINRPSSNYQSLFGFTTTSVISNLSVVNVNIIGQHFVGGLVGRNHFSTITNCYSTGSVSGSSYVGGLVGTVTYNSTITNCYSTGSVDGSSYVGGLAGTNDSSSITNCYSTGSVNGSSYTGGLIGSNPSGSPVLNSFWNTETSGQNSSAGGTGKTTAEMQTLSTFIDAGWDFIDETVNGTDDYWEMNGSYNSGYPFLSWQGYSLPPAVPQNVIISIVGLDLQITWDAASNATSYKVYSSDEPYSGFAEDFSGTFINESWTAPISDDKKFYYVVSSTETGRNESSKQYITKGIKGEK